MDLTNSIITIFITLVPLLIFKYKGLPDKDKLISFLISFAWMMASLVLSPLLISALKFDISWLTIIPSAVLISLYNFFLLKGDLDLKKLPKTLVVVSLFFFSSLFQLIPIRLFHLTSENMNPTISTVLTLFSDICVLAVLIVLYWKDLKEDFKKLRKNFNAIFDTSLRYWLIGLFLMMASNLLINLLSPQSIAGNEEAVQTMLDQTPVITFICAAVLAPVIEELVFRKSFKDIFKNKWLFVLTSGIVFGSLHVIFSINSAWDLLYIIPYSSLGIAFAYILQKTDNVYSSILVHFIHNAMLTSISILTGMVLLP